MKLKSLQYICRARLVCRTLRNRHIRWQLSFVANLILLLFERTPNVFIIYIYIYIIYLFTSLINKLDPQKKPKILRNYRTRWWNMGKREKIRKHLWKRKFWKFSSIITVFFFFFKAKFFFSRLWTSAFCSLVAIYIVSRVVWFFVLFLIVAQHKTVK